jgi:Ca2+/Na+ antiporter
MEEQRKSELNRANGRVRYGFQFSENAAFLGTTIVVSALILSINLAWILVMLIVLATACYGYISGLYACSKVTVLAGKESRMALECERERYRIGLALLQVMCLDLLYLLEFMHAWHFPIIHGLILIGFAGIVVGIQLGRWKYIQKSERYYALLPVQELGTELMRRKQFLVRNTMGLMFVSIIGLVFSHQLFVFPPYTHEGQTAFAVAFMMLVLLIGNNQELKFTKRWKSKWQVRVQKKEPADA